MRARIVAALGLALVAASIVIQARAGVDFPTVPPALVVSLALGATLLVVRRPWILLLGLVWPAFLAVGAVASGSLERLEEPARNGDFHGLALQLIGMAVAAAASLVALERENRPSQRASRRSRR